MVEKFLDTAEQVKTTQLHEMAVSEDSGDWRDELLKESSIQSFDRKFQNQKVMFNRYQIGRSLAEFYRRKDPDNVSMEGVRRRFKSPLEMRDGAISLQMNKRMVMTRLPSKKLNIEGRLARIKEQIERTKLANIAIDKDWRGL